MRNRPHDGRCIRFVLVLAALLVPVCQLPEHVVMELSCQARECIGAFGVRLMTRSTWRNLSLRDSFLIDLLALRHALPWRPSKRLGVEILEMLGQSLQRRRAQN